MTFERVAAAPAEPAPPAQAAGPVEAVAAGEPVPAALRLQILSTEHWSLLATRSLAWNEVFARASTHLSALSGAIVALALVGQGSGFGQTFLLFGIVILPVVLFIGVGTFVRMGASNTYDAMCVVGMNRIRAAYLELAPDLERYFVMSANDDVRGVGITMGVQPGSSSVLHLIAATPVVISVINASVAAAVVGMLAALAGAATAPIVAACVVAFLLVVAAHTVYGRRNIAQGQGALRPLFPGR